MDPWMIAGGAIVVLAVGFFIARVRPMGPEVSVGSVLSKLDNSYTVLTGAIVRGEKGMIRLDYVVVSPYGVFVIKECREPGRVEVRLNQEEWRISGGGLKKMYNPVWDIRKVVGKLERLVGEYPYIPLVVFTRARLTGDVDFNVMGAGNLLERIENFRETRLSEDQQKKIMGILS
ncbi:MAG: NERD domain-containing protein [Nitrospinota bacterium]|nr:NERD domain-containing protein [Nitrospinota bacterium]